jgi:hypothetical protein
MDRVHAIATFSLPRPPCFAFFVALPLGVSASIATSSAVAASWDVSFDLTPSVACRDVTTAEFAEANPDERLVEAQIEVSSLIRRGKEDALLEYFYRFDSPRRTLRIMDYWPKTTLTSDMAGNVTVENKQEATKGLGMTVAAPLDWPVKFGSSGELGIKTLHATRYELVPPMSVVAASGTLDRGHSVYFKLRPSRSTSLEGAKPFTLVFRVDTRWRADYVHLTCTASGVAKGLLGPLDEQKVRGRQRFVVALYAEGDASAKAAAERLVRAESELLKTISANRQALEKRFYPTLAHRFSAMFDGASAAALPDSVADAVVYGDRTTDKDRLDLRLPSEVRQAVVRYTVARRALSSLRCDETSAETSDVQ